MKIFQRASLDNLSLGNVALLETILNHGNEALGQRGADPVNIRSRDGISKLSSDNIIRKSKALVGDKSKAAILGREDGESSRLLAIRVDLRVQSTLVEDIQHVGKQLVVNDTLLAIAVNGAEFGYSLGHEATGEQNEQFICARMDMQLADGTS